MRGLRRGTVGGVLALLAVVLSGALAGCGGGSEAAPASGTARFSDAASFAEAVSTAVQEQGSYQVWMAQSSNSLTVEYFVALRDPGQDYAITVTHPQEWVTVIELADTYYLSRGTDSTTQAWQQVPFGTIQSDPDLGSLAVEADWPTKFRAMAQAEDFVPSAPTSSDGQTTTTYTLVLGQQALSQMLRSDLLTDQQRQELPSVMAGQSATVEVKLGEDNLPRSVIWSYGTSSVTVSTHYAFSRWGEITVEAPDLG